MSLAPLIPIILFVGGIALAIAITNIGLANIDPSANKDKK